MWKKDPKYIAAGYRDGMSECGLCIKPCATCEKCWSDQKNCHQWDCEEPKGSNEAIELAKKGKKTCDINITNEPSAHFCTSCK